MLRTKVNKNIKMLITTTKQFWPGAVSIPKLRMLNLNKFPPIYL